MTLLAIWGETRKELLVMWSYRFANIFDILSYSMVYIAALFLIGQGEFQQDLIQNSLIGYIVTFFVLETLTQMGYAIMDEMQEGTLEQMNMGIVNTSWLLIGKVIAIQMKALVAMLIMGVGLSLLFQVEPLFLRPEALAILLLSLVGVMGFAYLIAGMTIVFKHIGSVVSAIYNLILFLNGTFLPLESMPDWMRWIAQLFPTTQGIVVMRRVLIGGELNAVLLDGSLLLLAVHSMAYLLAGVALFQWCEHRAKVEGSLGHY